MPSLEVPQLTPFKMSQILELAVRNKIRILMTGSPGQGKSTLIDQVAKICNADLLISHPVVDSAIDYKGMPALLEVMLKTNGKSKAKTTKTAEFLPFGDLRKLIDAQKLTIHFADDLGPSAKMVQAAYGQLLLNRAINGHAVSDNVVFMAATNRKEDKSGVTGIIEMLKDRFHGIYELVNSLEDWVQWAFRGNKIPHELISFVRYRPKVLDAFEPTLDMSRTPTPRALEQMGDWIKAGVPKELQMSVFSGCIGKQYATEYIGFLKIYKDLPDPDKVIMDPKNSEIPDPSKVPGSLIALCGALAARATVNSVERIITYANRLPAEFATMLVNDSTSKDPKLCNNIAFIKWAADNQNVLI